MESKTEQQVNLTLDCMNENLDIQISPLFTENLNSRIADTRIPRNTVYRTRIFYPVLIVLLMALNLAAGLTNFKSPQPLNNTSNNQAGILASEYGIGQNSFTAF